MADKGFMTVSQLDYDSESTAFRVRVPALTVGNFTAQETKMDALRDALAAITIGTVSKTVYGNEDLLSITPASAEASQRELKWLVSCHDATTFDTFSYEIGCADTDLLDENDRRHAEIGDASFVDAFVTAFEAVAISPVAGNQLLVDEITLVGRPI